MDAQQPPRYHDLVGGDEEEEATKKSLRWSQTQMLLVVSAVAIVIADLALTVKTHGLYQKAVAHADQASSDAKQALKYTIDLGDVNHKIAGLDGRTASAQRDIESLQTALAKLTSSVSQLPHFTSELQSNATTLQKGLSDLKSNVDQLSDDTSGLKTNARALQKGQTNLTSSVHHLSDDASGIRSDFTTLQKGVGNLTSRVDNIEYDINSGYTLSKGIKARGMSSASAMTVGWMSLGGVFALVL